MFPSYRVKTSRQTTLKVSKSKSVTTPKPDDVTKFEDCIGKCYNVKSIQSHVVRSFIPTLVNTTYDFS